MEICYSDTALKQLKHIIKSDPKSARMIITKIENYQSDPEVQHDIKILKGNLGELIRLRAGNYRIIFDISQDCMSIYEIKHRQGVYND
jgi:mRNA-degrading endonuclease RelE of RelBE toxin-antitoxin system